MTKRVLAAAIAAAFLAMTMLPVASPPAQAAAAEKAEKKKTEKKLTTQQQKMKDCAGKWNEHKAKTKAKGRDAYRKFMSDCLKST